MKEKVLPIIDSTRKFPSFYAAKPLNKNELKEIIRFYEFILGAEQRRIRLSSEEAKQSEN